MRRSLCLVLVPFLALAACSATGDFEPGLVDSGKKQDGGSDGSADSSLPPLDADDADDAGGDGAIDGPVDSAPTDSGADGFDAASCDATVCGTSCVDLSSDPKNCGACGKACVAPEMCVAGKCIIDCSPPMKICGSKCVDLLTDHDNCGACSVPCAVDEACVSAACEKKCTVTKPDKCLGVCVDLKTDHDNCGACGKACASAEACKAGLCECLSGGTKCGGVCVDTTKDSANCGGCGIACTSGKVCVSSACVCGTGTSLCSGTCVDTKTDAKNCGACGKACSGAESCVAGVCTCSKTLCSGVCTDTSSDSKNCGACGKVCATGTACVSGVCKTTITTLEDFDKSGWMYSPWSTIAGGTSGTVSSTCAHDGSSGLGDAGWIYRTDVTVGAAGDKIAVWGKPGTGRLYFGFGASATGAWSLVMAPNTNEFKFQQKGGDGDTERAALTFSYTAGKWYKMEVTFGSGGSVTGRLYDSDGTTVLATNTTTLTGLTTGGIALRSFGSFCIDTITKS